MAGFRFGRSPYMKLGPVRVRRGIVYRAIREQDQRKRAATRTATRSNVRSSPSSTHAILRSSTTRSTRSSAFSTPTADPTGTSKSAWSSSAGSTVSPMGREWSASHPTVTASESYRSVYKPAEFMTERHARWYETDTSQSNMWAYPSIEYAEQNRTLARAWGWESSPPQYLLRHAYPVNSVFVVSYYRSSVSAAAASVKRQWMSASQWISTLASKRAQIVKALTSLFSTLDVARTEESDPVLLEIRVRRAAYSVIEATQSLTREQALVIACFQDALQNHASITTVTPLVREMALPPIEEIELRLREKQAQFDSERIQIQTVLPAIEMQEQVVAAVQEWQAAVAKRWRAQLDYLPVETWWDRVRVQLGLRYSLTPAIEVSREAVATQILRADEVGPEDEAWKQAEAEVANKEAVLLHAIQARDAAMAAVAKAFGVVTSGSSGHESQCLLH